MDQSLFETEDRWGVTCSVGTPEAEDGGERPTHLCISPPTSTVFFCCIIEAPYMAVRSRLCVVMSHWVLEMGFPCVATHELTHPFSVSNFQ